MDASLTPFQLDQSLYQEPKDDRKPLRQFIDDKLMPNIGMIAAPPLAAMSMLGNLQRTPKITQVPQ